jgi:hypothetical protein
VDKWLQLVFTAAVFIYLIFLEFIDWQGRAEVLELKYPWLWRAVNNRPARLLLLVLAVGLLVKDFKDAVAIAPPPVVNIAPPPVPAITIVKSPEKLKDQCWLTTIGVATPKDLPQNWRSSESVIFCNKKVNAPLFLQVEFDQNPVGVSPPFFPEGRMIKMHQSFQLNKVLVDIESPSILPYQIFIINAHSDKEKAPIATAVTVKTINPNK